MCFIENFVEISQIQQENQTYITKAFLHIQKEALSKNYKVNSVSTFKINFSKLLTLKDLSLRATQVQIFTVQIVIEKTTKGAFCRYSSKQVFLKISQNLQENTCVGVSFNKVAGLKVQEFFRKGTPTQVLSCKCCEIFKNRFFIEQFWWLSQQLQNILP